MKKITVIAACLLLMGCFGEENEDIRLWMKEASKDLKGKVPPLPEVKPYESVSYDMAGSTDPFDPSRLGLERSAGSGGIAGPDRTRPPEPLEAYPLESLKYVGLITKKKVSYAIILADGALHQVKAGNYMGQNFGKISQINDMEITLTELVQDSLGDWSERTSALFLQEQEGIQ